jgi:nucleoside-diphosphate-sugar epimerase
MSDAESFEFSHQYKNQKVLVTGATGFIGAPVCRRLVENGAKVYAVSRSRQKSTTGQLSWIQADPAELCAIREVYKNIRPDVVFHFAGVSTAATNLDLVTPTFHSQVASTVYLLSCAAEFGCSRFVITGSLTEPTLEHVGPGSPYAAAKWASTVYGQMFYRLYKTPVVIVRPFMTFGPGQSEGKLVPYVTLSALRGESPKLSSGQWQADWVYIDDVVAGFIAAGATPGTDGLIIDLGSGALTSVRDVVQRIIALTGDKVKPIFGASPDRPFEQIRVADTQYAYATLGWKPRVSLSEGLERTILWLRQQVNEYAVR